MASLAFLLILAGGLELILEFGSVTFLLVSLLMAYANYKIHNLTHSSRTLTIFAIIGLMVGTILIFYYEFSRQLEQMLFIAAIYILLTLVSWFYSKTKKYEGDLNVKS